MELLGFKTCTKCKCCKPVGSFRIDTRRGQLRTQCRECEAEARMRRYNRERERKGHTQYMQGYRQRPIVAWKNKLRQDTRTLILAGIIRHPGCCESCGEVAGVTINCHHNSYLVCDDVTFLCESCHQQWHRDNQAPPEPSEKWVSRWYRKWKEYPYVDE